MGGFYYDVNYIQNAFENYGARGICKLIRADLPGDEMAAVDTAATGRGRVFDELASGVGGEGGPKLDNC